MSMDNEQFQCWLAGIDSLSAAQRREAEAVFSGRTGSGSSLAAVELAVDADRHCPHCGKPGAVSRGKARGLRRYQCKICRRTFNAATGTPLSGLHYKDRWLAFGGCLAAGETVRASADHCNLAVNTAFRWRHRFLEAAKKAPQKLPKGSSRSMKPMFWRATRDREPSTASPAKEAARLASAACRANRCRF